METAEKKWEFEFDMPTNIQMANADRFKDGVDPESEAGSVVHIYGQAVAALGERLAYWQKGRTVKTTKIGDASITIDVRGVPELQEDLNRIGVRLQVAEIERGAFAGTIDNLRASLDLVDGDSLEGAVRSIKKDRDRLAKDIDSSVIGLGKSRVDRIEELEKEVSGLVRSLDHWNRETHKAEKDRDGEGTFFERDSSNDRGHRRNSARVRRCLMGVRGVPGFRRARLSESGAVQSVGLNR